MAQVSIDQTDRKLLGVLADQGRISNADLADAIALSPSPCLRRVKRLETEGVIRGYGAKLDMHKLGWGITAFIFIKSQLHSKAEVRFFEETLARMPRVMSCYVVAGQWDVVLHVVAKDFDDYYDLATELGAVEFVKDIQSTIVIGEIKGDTGVPVV